MAPIFEVLSTEDGKRWAAALDRAAAYDFYHTAEYHRIAEHEGEGRGHLFVLADDDHLVALPLLIRDCAPEPGLEGSSARDATSAYGYVGPVSTAPPRLFVERFQASLREALAQQNVVTVFSRLHPLIPQEALLDGLGEVHPAGLTVSIDLTRPEQEQVAGIRENHVRNIRKLREMGAMCRLDEDGSLHDFATLYYETMRRVGAAPSYYFRREYFRQLGELRGSRVHLFSCLLGGDVIAAGLFFECNGIVQYHLGATRPGFESLAPMKLVLESARAWASGNGMRILHLGGGVGAREDSLFRFKAGFSDRRHTYATWRWVTDPDQYAVLNREKEAWNAEHRVDVAAEYFPRYRSGVTLAQHHPVARAGEASDRGDAELGQGNGADRTLAGAWPAWVRRDRAADRTNVLVLAAGRRTALVRAFLAAGRPRGARTIAADVDPLAPALYLADDAVRTRRTDDPGYVDDLVRVVEQHDVALLVPTIDPDLPVLARARERLGTTGCVVAVSDTAFVDMAYDKYAMWTGLRDLGIALAASWLPGDPRDAMPEEVYVKPRQGSASADNHIVALNRLDAVLPLVPDPIIQEVLTGPEVTIDALLDAAGRPIHFVPRRRIRTLGGESIQGVTLGHDPDLEAWIVGLLETFGALGAWGPLCLQAFLTDRGPVLSEINPRFGGGFPLGMAAGADYPAWLLDMIAGVPVAARLGEYEPGVYMTRYNVEQFTRAPKW